jgi:hypothetical protein
MALFLSVLVVALSPTICVIVTTAFSHARVRLQEPRLMLEEQNRGDKMRLHYEERKRNQPAQ